MLTHIGQIYIGLRNIMQSQNDTLLRLLTMLRHIPVHPQQVTAKELTERLKSDRFEVSKRTVERDLLSLSEIFSLISNERSRPYGWSWSKQSNPQHEEVEQLLNKAINVGKFVNFSYSDALREETREMLYQMPLTHDDHIHMKNEDGRFGKISIYDLMDNKKIIKDKRTDDVYYFNSTDQLLEAGWVID